MAEKFDNFSKHLASKHSRRGLFRILGVGVVGAALSAVFTKDADAGRGGWTSFNSTLPYRENQIPYRRNRIPYRSPEFNFILPDLNSTDPL